MEWSKKRRILYSLGIAGFIILISAYPIYKFMNPTPTCFDVKQNGTEVGVDCGGSCNLYCSSQIQSLRIIWSKAIQITSGHYDLGAYVENPNPSAGIKNARYVMRVLGSTGEVLAQGEGVIEIPPASTALLFIGNVPVTGTPEKVEVEFNSEDTARWLKASPKPAVLTIKNQTLKNVDTKPRLDAVLLNNDLVEDSGYVALSAIIYDAVRRPFAISSTFTDNVPKGGEKDIFFTWPNRFTKNNKGSICTTPVDTILVFDRSGSMNIGNKNPPEPLTTAKNAVNTYVDSADLADKVGIVSFATTPSNPIDHELSLDHDAVRNAMGVIAIEKGSLQHTNLGDALKSAIAELQSIRHTKDAKKVIVAFTDGIANKPSDPVNAKNISYPEDYAAEASTIARMSGVEIYTIGLGLGINEKFLRDRIATDPEHSFIAPTASDLQQVYKKISESVCKGENFITEVIITPHAVFDK